MSCDTLTSLITEALATGLGACEDSRRGYPNDKTLVVHGPGASIRCKRSLHVSLQQAPRGRGPKATSLVAVPTQIQVFQVKRKVLCALLVYPLTLCSLCSQQGGPRSHVGGG